jgi:tetrahydromethanopterin S-methyltransferase subunit A
MNSIAVAGRLLSENKGIDALVRYVVADKRIRCIVLAGKDSKGHLAGQSLLALWLNGIDDEGRIIGSMGKDAVLTLSKDEVDEFRAQISTMIDMRGVTDVDSIRKCIMVDTTN